MRLRSILLAATVVAVAAATVAATAIANTLDLVSVHGYHRVKRQPNESKPFPDFDYTTEKIRGVNIGGWLVLEPWITPSLFDQFLSLPEQHQAVDEWTFCEKLGADEAHRQLKQHWDTWVQEEDFHKLAASGINHIRIPVGYWAIDVAPDEPYVQGHIPYLKKAVAWARNAGLRVIIDLHGAPGSQNGFDNSGRRGPVRWQEKPENIERTLNAFTKLVAMFNQTEHDHVVGFQILNEPAGFALDVEKIREFYREGIRRLRAMHPHPVAVAHDAFLPLHDWTDFVRSYRRGELILDTHIYHVFGDEPLGMDYEKHLNLTCSDKKRIAQSQLSVPTIVGEWSLAVSDCTLWLNGFNVGTRWEGTHPSRHGRPIHPGAVCMYDHDVRYFDTYYLRWLRRFAEIQMDAYEAGSGWFFWTFKTERSPQWDYMMGLEHGWIPRDHSKRQFTCENRHGTN